MAVSQAIASLKSQRKFAETVRLGILLMLDLQSGHTDVLTELFPWTLDALKSTAPPPDIGHLERKIEQLEQVVLSQAMAVDYPAPAMKPAGGFQLEVTDDDQDTVVLKPTASTDAGMNFLGGLANYSQ